MNTPTKEILNLHKLFTPEEASEILGITPGTLQQWRTVGRYNLPFVKVGGRVMYSPVAIQAFIESRTIAHTA